MAGPLPATASGRCQAVSGVAPTVPCQRTESPATMTESLLALLVTSVPD